MYFEDVGCAEKFHHLWPVLCSLCETFKPPNDTKQQFPLKMGRFSHLLGELAVPIALYDKYDIFKNTLSLDVI